MIDEKSTTKHNLKEYKRSSNFTIIYTNNVNFAFTPIDIHMICSRTVASMDKKDESIEELATLIMTPQHAKAVLQAFANHIQEYEKAHGEIKMSENKLPQQPTKEELILGSASRRKKK
jgi:hypothetical protein